MQAELTRMVADLVSADASACDDKTFKARLLELAKISQVVPDQRYLLRAVSRNLMAAVETVFGPLSLILILTEPGRRQVYFAVLARLLENGLPSGDACQDAWRRDLLERLLLDSNEALIAQAYGTCPSSFCRVLTRLGNAARPRGIYISLFNLLCELPSLGPALLSEPLGALNDSLIELLAAVPRVPEAIQLAKRFEQVVEYQRFMRAYCIVTGENMLRGDHLTRICAGEAPATIINELYLALPFGPPQVAIPSIRYIKNGAELMQASRDFDNCLSRLVAEALRGERQYYVWEKKGEPAVVFCIIADSPFGWYFSESKLARNKRVPRHLREELKSLLGFAGIHTDGSVEGMMRQFVDRTEDIDFDELHDLLEIEAA